MKKILDEMCYEIEKIQEEEQNYPSYRDSIINKYTRIVENEKTINVTIIGNDDREHHTYVEYNGRYWSFYTDGYDGEKSKDIIGFLKYLGFKVFTVNKSNGSKRIKPENSNWEEWV